MRYLNIQRRKSIFYCLNRVKVYVEDRYGDTRINDCMCSRIGTLKNGEEARFSIPEDEIKVFVVFDKRSRNMINDFRTIPAGDADVYLSGIVESEVFGANLFRFDGDGDAKSQSNRKRVKKNSRWMFVIGIIAALAIGIAEPLLEHHIETRPKDFAAQGMTITLNNSFKESSGYDFAAAYASDHAMVIVQKEEFSLAEGFEDLSLQEYGELAIQVTPHVEEGQLQEGNHFLWFDYTGTPSESGEEYSYLTCFYKSENAFWTVQFITESGRVEKLRPEHMEWAATVRFD